MERKRKRNLLQEIEKALSTIGKYLGLYGTAMKLAQFAPIVLGLLVVFFSPSAWLSETLRQWAVTGVVLGGLVGIMISTLVGMRQEHKQGLAVVMTAIFLASAAILRLQLALVDIAFVERWSLLRPAQDFFLGSDAGELLYNALSAFWFGLVLFSATFGLALYVQWAREQQHAAASTDTKEGWQEIRTALETASKGFEKLLETLTALQEENRALKEQLEGGESIIKQTKVEKAQRDVQRSETEAQSGQ